MSPTQQVARRYHDASTSVAEQLTVRDGRITSSDFVTDMAAFAAFAGAGDRG
jgi:ketosteroid isomerase-like protein